MPVITIDKESNAILDEHIGDEKAKASREGKPVKAITKNSYVSNLIKRALAKPKRAAKPNEPATKIG